MTRQIHLIWFGGKPFPKLVQRCIASWRQHMPDWEVRVWTEQEFDVHAVPYCAEAYSRGRYAFVSDYARFWILYHHGGIYMDTDVMLLRPLDALLKAGPFLACEGTPDVGVGPMSLRVNPGLIAYAEPGLPLFGEILDRYRDLHFLRPDGKEDRTTIVEYTTEFLVQRGLRCTDQPQPCAGVTVYPKDYFCPIDFMTKRKTMTANTHAIHYYAGSWQSPLQRLQLCIRRTFGEGLLNWMWYFYIRLRHAFTLSHISRI